MLYNPITLANYFILKSFDEGISITPMKVLKLVYIANGWYLGYNEKPLITDRSQAWKYGPVIPTVYDVFKGYGRHEIENVFMPTQDLQNDYGRLSSDRYTSSFLNSVWDVYKIYDGLQLSDLTHKEGTPWYITYNAKGNLSTIPNELIQDHYKNKIKQNG